MKDLTTRADIELLVNTFYKKVENDGMIGPIFTEVVKVDWEHHLPKMYDFWDAILFGQKGFKGNPMEVHFKINRQYPLLTKHFDRWKHIFNDTLDELFSGEYAELAKQKAQSIADLMLFKMNKPSDSITIKRTP